MPSDQSRQSEPMTLRCCSTLWIELDQHPRFSLRTLCEGGDGFDRTPRWRACAAHLDAPIEIDLDDLALLQRVAAAGSCDDTTLEPAAAMRAESLRRAGLLLDAEDERPAARRDASLRAATWWGPAAIAHLHGRWHDHDISALWEAEGALSSQDMVDAFGPAPCENHRRTEGTPAQLPLPRRNAFDELLAARLTCRNFDAEAALDQTTLATMLFRMIGVLGTQTFAPGAVAVKKHAPGGGGLHVTEAYVLVRRVEGLGDGLYHYCSHEHALEPLHALDDEAAQDLAYRALAGQSWFVDAPVLVFLTSRYDRLQWKYRRHSKAWKVAQLDAGHISMLMYLSAAELGLGAFVTAAINDSVIEQALSLDPVVEGATAIVGFGARSAEVTTRELTELDPSPVVRRLREAARTEPPGEDNVSSADSSHTA